MTEEQVRLAVRSRFPVQFLKKRNKLTAFALLISISIFIISYIGLNYFYGSMTPDQYQSLLLRINTAAQSLNTDAQTLEHALTLRFGVTDLAQLPGRKIRCIISHIAFLQQVVASSATSQRARSRQGNLFSNL